jgi:hypothetical protein
MHIDEKLRRCAFVSCTWRGTAHARQGTMTKLTLITTLLLAACASDPTVRPLARGGELRVQHSAGFCAPTTCETTMIMRGADVVETWDLTAETAAGTLTPAGVAALDDGIAAIPADAESEDDCVAVDAQLVEIFAGARTHYFSCSARAPFAQFATALDRVREGLRAGEGNELVTIP